MRVKNNIFYRLYGDECYVWDLNNQKEFIFSNSVFYILDAIKRNKEISLEELMIHIDEMLGTNNRNYIIEFLEQLQDLNIVEDLQEKIITIDDKIDSKLYGSKILFSTLFELTYRCNEKCIHCYAENDDSRRELTTEQAMAVIDNLFDANVAEITFSGGEAFIREDAIDIIEYAYEKGFLINIFSNGINLNDSTILRLAKCHIKSYQTSIYGSNALLHDSITGVPGSFEKTISVLKTMTNLGITTCMKTTIMQKNVNDYSNIKLLADSIGCGLQVGLSIIPTLSKNKEKVSLRICDKDLLKIKKAEIMRYNFEDVKEALDDGALGLCNAGHTNFTINPYGEIILCTGLDEVIGNAVSDNILDLWLNSEILNKWRMVSKNSLECRKTCDDREYCTFCPAQAYLESGSPFSKYKEACVHAKVTKTAKEELWYEYNKEENS